MHELSILPFTGFIFVVLTIGLLLRWLKQPYVVSYILAGIVLGPHCLSIVSDKVLLVQLGSIGVLFLLFFVGMELSVPNLASSWKIAVFGTMLQILASVGFVWGFGHLIGWPLERSIALGFVISLSSTAVIIKLLQDQGTIDTPLGRNVLGILLVQDVLIVPILIVLNSLGGEKLHIPTFVAQIICGGLIIAVLGWIFVKKVIQLPFSKFIRIDREMEVFAALMLCFGLALVTELCHLSAALGAFVAGIIVSAASETYWVSKSLEPFRVVFVGLFFISIGMLIDLEFLLQHPFKVSFLVAAVFFTNTFINAFVFRLLGSSSQESLNAGALLAQIGELSFLVAAVGYKTHMLTEFAYQSTILTISISLLLSPTWIWIVGKLANGDFVKRTSQELRNS